MESQEQREVKKSNKAAAIALALLIVAGAAFAAYKAGVIPGFGGGQVANDLKAEIEASKGANIKSKIVALYQNNPNIPPQVKDAIAKGINEGVDMNFDYAGLKASTGEGKGTVEIDAPKLSMKTLEGAQKTAVEIHADKLFISRDVTDPSHYFFHSEGNLEIYADPTNSGTVAKMLTITADAPANEFKMSNDMISGYMKSTAKNVKFIEGRGNTVLATIGDVSTEASRQKTGAKIDVWGKMSYKNIIPGDMIKIMLGQIDPININLDYAYKGDDYNEQFMKLMQYPEQQQAERVKAMQDPNYKPTTPPAPPEFQPFDGAAKLNDFSIMMGNAGLAVQADLTFKKDNPKIIPSGTGLVKIAQYQKLIDYFKKFFPIPQEQVDKSIQMLSEIGQNSNGDITIDFKLDGTENMIIGGKTMEQIKAIQAKYAEPTVGRPASPDAVQAAPPATVKGKPIVGNQTKI